MQPTLTDIVRCAEALAREAGRRQLDFFRKPHLHVDTKLNESDIVTEADAASEQIILAGIRRAFPGHGVLSEESGASGAAQSPWLWVVDPLDGTTNFSEGLPAFSVSIGIEYEGERVAAVVHAPYLDETFSATRGGGARLNGHPVHCRANRLMERAVVATGFPVDKNTNPDNNMDNLGRVLPLVRGVRRLGSAALDLCYVAAGFLDAYWELNLHRWDVSAGLLIVEEAGGRFSEFRQGRNISILAGSPAIYQQMEPLIR